MKATAAIFMAVLAMFFLGFAFAFWSIDPATWPQGARVLCAGAAAFSASMAAILSRLE